VDRNFKKVDYKYVLTFVPTLMVVEMGPFSIFCWMNVEKPCFNMEH